jgi:hypothetical protein
MSAPRVMAAGLTTIAPTGDTPDRIAGEDIRTGRIDWQRPDISGTGQKRPTLPNSGVTLPAYLFTDLHR